MTTQYECLVCHFQTPNLRLMKHHNKACAPYRVVFRQAHKREAWRLLAELVDQAEGRRP